MIVKLKMGLRLITPAKPGITIVAPGGVPPPFTPTTNADGSYTLTGLISATYDVQYAPLPDGYVITHPLNVNPPTFVARVGTNCAQATPNPGGNCNNGNLQELNFGIKAGQPWFQALGLDVST